MFIYIYGTINCQDKMLSEEKKQSSMSSVLLYKWKKKKDTQIGFCLYKQLLPVVFGVRGLVPTHSAESHSGQIIVRHPSPTSGDVLGLWGGRGAPESVGRGGPGPVASLPELWTCALGVCFCKQLQTIRSPAWRVERGGGGRKPAHWPKGSLVCLAQTLD